jgi:Leu/Phe-tRNA-protein transferase
MVLFEIKRMYLKYTVSGHLFISPEDDCHAIVDAMLETGYNEEFCIAGNFDAEFTARMMEAGFLIMSMNLNSAQNEDAGAANNDDYILLPKLHLERSALFFENLHVKKSARRLLNRYELKADVEFDRIVDRCVEKHGSDWLTPPLVECIKEIRRTESLKDTAYPSSFALYRDRELVAGEFGVICGNVYTSYSGYYDEDNAGTVQLILTTRYLQKNGFLFFDLGMPMDYKTSLGAVNIYPDEFVKLFRQCLSTQRLLFFLISSCKKRIKIFFYIYSF